MGGNGSSWVGVSASGTQIHNNTIVGYKRMNAMILVNGGTGNVVANNLWYDIGAGVNSSCSANLCQTNTLLTQNIFKNYPIDLTLAQPTMKVTVLSSPYNSDLKNVIRGSDGSWDLGAFEFAQ